MDVINDSKMTEAGEDVQDGCGGVCQLITDKFTINSAGKTPQQRRLDSLSMAFSSKMAPHAIDFSGDLARDKAVSGFLQKSTNDQNISTFLTNSSIFGTKTKFTPVHKESFYKAGSFFDCESNSELGDNSMEQSTNLFESEANFQFENNQSSSEFQFNTNRLNAEESTDLFNDADVEKTNIIYTKLKSKHTKYKNDEDKENNTFIENPVDKSTSIKCIELRSPLNEINSINKDRKVNHFKTFMSQNSIVNHKFGNGTYDGIVGVEATSKTVGGVRARRRVSDAELGSPLKRKTSCGSFSGFGDDGRTPSKFSVVLNSLSTLPGNMSTSSPYVTTPSKSPPCKRRSSSAMDPCQMSSDSGFENSVTANSSNFERARRTRKKSIARGSLYPPIVDNEIMRGSFQDDDMSESARSFDDMPSTSRLNPLSEDIVSKAQQNLSDYDFDTLHDLEEEFDLDNTMNHSVSKYEIISTDSPNILRVESTSYAANNLEFGSPIGDCETSETFGSCRKPVMNFSRKMPVRTETTRMLNFDIDSSANSTFQFTPPTKLPARHSFDFGIRNKNTSTYGVSPKSDSKIRSSACGFNSKLTPNKNDMTPNKQNDSFSFGIKTLADRYSFVDSGVPNWNDSPISSSNTSHKKTESVSVVPGSRRSRLFSSMSTNSIESSSCISEMEDCMLFDMESNNCIEDTGDEGVDVNYSVPQSLGALISSEIKDWDDGGKDGTPSRDGTSLTLKRPLFRRCFSLTAESEASNAIERVRVTLFKSPVNSRSTHAPLSSCTPSDLTRTAFKRPEAPGSNTFNSEGSTGKRRRKSSCFSLLSAHYENEAEGSLADNYCDPMIEDVSVKSDLKTGGLIRSRPVLQRALSENCSMLKTSLVDIESYNEPDLIGDFSMPFILPLTTSQHQDLKAINGDTLARLIQGHYKDTIQHFQVIDCRYPYEYSGGHIVGAENLFTEELIKARLLGMSTSDNGEDQVDHRVSHVDSVPSAVSPKKRRILVFHCEFSSERGPKLCRFLRTVDRDIHKDTYPNLHHPELYVLRGGYRSFHQVHADLCRPTPGAYTPMMDPKHVISMKAHRAAASRSKSTNRIGR